MIEHRKFFQNGAIKYGLSKHKANEIFNEIEKFAGYGFNKSHATAYALLSYYTAYLKTHYSSFLWLQIYLFLWMIQIKLKF